MSINVLRKVPRSRCSTFFAGESMARSGYCPTLNKAWSSASGIRYDSSSSRYSPSFVRTSLSSLPVHPILSARLAAAGTSYGMSTVRESDEAAPVNSFQEGADVVAGIESIDLTNGSLKGYVHNGQNKESGIGAESDSSIASELEEVEEEVWPPVNLNLNPNFWEEVYDDSALGFQSVSSSLPELPAAPPYPCEILSDKEVEIYLQPLYSRSWSVIQRTMVWNDRTRHTLMLAKQIDFGTFKLALEFISESAIFIRAERHHPTISIAHKLVTISIHTHTATIPGVCDPNPKSVNHTHPGITLRDVRLAILVEQLWDKFRYKEKIPAVQPPDLSEGRKLRSVRSVF